MSYPDNPRNDPERTDVGDSPVTDTRTSTDLRESGTRAASTLGHFTLGHLHVRGDCSNGAHSFERVPAHLSGSGHGRRRR